MGSQVDRKGRCFPFGTAYGNAVLSAAPITDSSNHHYVTPSSEPRGYVELTTTVDGQQVRVVATHLAEKRQGLARQRQAQELVDAVAGTFPRTIILGDFNAIPNTPEIAAVRKAGFHDADPGCNQPPFAACKATADAGPPRKKFDYIFLNGIASPGIGVHPNPSDHDLVHADLDLNAPPGPPGTFGHSRPVYLPPTVDAGPRRNGAEGSTVRLDGSASDDHGAPALHWFVSPGTDVDAGTRCRFSDPTAATPTLSCTDNGTFTLTLTADDGVNATVSDSTTVHLRNVAPTLHITAPAPWTARRAGSSATARATFTDPGSNDTHTCRTAWDDGTVTSRPAHGHACTLPHGFGDAGMFDTRTTVTDDDGGADTGERMVIVYEPTAGLAVSAATAPAPAGTHLGHPQSGTLDVFALSKYVTTDAQHPAALLTITTSSGLHLSASTVEWLVITHDGKVAIMGTAGSDNFLVYLRADAARAVVWPTAQGRIPPASPLFDNRRGASYDIDHARPQPLTHGLNVTDSGWIPGVPSLDQSLISTLQRCSRRLARRLHCGPSSGVPREWDRG